MAHKILHMCGNPECKQYSNKRRIRKGLTCEACGWHMLTAQEFQDWVGYELEDEPTDELFSEMVHEQITGHHRDDRHISLDDMIFDINHRKRGTQPLLPLSNGNTNGHKPEKKPDDTFSAPACLTGCPIAQGPVIEIPYALYQVWVGLARAIDTEWLAYLRGEVVDGVYKVTDMTFPEQSATSVHVSARDGVLVPEGTIAAVHSHVGMDVFFSEEDKAHFNHPIELVVNRKGDLLANGISTLACGQIHRGPARIVFLGQEDIKPYVEALKAKLATPKQSIPLDDSTRREPVTTIRHHGRGVQ
jgi:hypothetical protein